MAEQVRAASPAALVELVQAFRVSQALHVTATLGVADLLAAGPRTADDLARATGTHAGALYRLLRAVASVGVLAEDDAGAFALTDLGQFLRADHPRSVHGNAVARGQPTAWGTWQHLRYSVATGEPAFRHLHGVDPWAYRAQHPDVGAAFDRCHDQQLAPAARRGGGRLRLLRARGRWSTWPAARGRCWPRAWPPSWRKRGYDLDAGGWGVAMGYATLGKIGFEGALQLPAAIGTVTNLEARLCGEARAGQVLVSQKVHAEVEGLAEAARLPDLTLKGFQRPVPAFDVLRLREAAPAARARPPRGTS